MIRIKVFDSINNVPKEQWNGLLMGHSCTYSHEFWEMLETSKLNDFTCRYVLFVDDDDKPVALASFYSITTDLAIFAPRRLRGILTKIRQIFPNFLRLRMLECGTPVTLNSPPFVMGEGISNGEAIASLSNLLLRTAKAEGHLLVVIRDFEPNADSHHSEYRKLGYHFVDSLPNTYMDIRWSTYEDYLASMKSYYRSKVLKHLRRNEYFNIRHELIDDFHDMADALVGQWMVVHNQADEFQREVLTSAFYREFSQKLDSRSKVILFYRRDALVGHALLLMDGDMLRWLYFGRNEAGNDSLYIYAGQKVIETAILLGAKRLELGLTTYSIKQDMGAQTVPIKLALRSPYRIINPLVGFIYPLINDPLNLQNKNIFKTEGTSPKHSEKKRADTST